MYVQKNRKTPRFEVDYRERIEQSRTASNAVRLPRLGYAQYRVYDIKERKEVSVPNFNGVYIKSGPVYKYNNGNLPPSLWAFIDELESKIEPPHQVKWLKPKQATLLRLQGHRVEKV
jgi:hypothetical protein